MSGERWRCPRCGRPFGRPNRPHTCAPALSLEAYFAERTPAQRRIFDAVAAHIAELDGVDIEAVSVGILFKASRTFAELRPRRDGLALTLLLARELAGRVAHVVPLHDAEDVDATVRAWLTEAYLGRLGVSAPAFTLVPASVVPLEPARSRSVNRACSRSWPRPAETATAHPAGPNPPAVRRSAAPARRILPVVRTGVGAAAQQREERIMIWTATRPGVFLGARGAFPGGPGILLQPAFEFGQLLRDPVFWGWGVPRGDGHTVLVLPGLGAGDAYLRPLRGWLRRLGYGMLRSGIRRNPGLSERLLAELGERVEAEYRRTGRRLSIVGHSMGGAQARAIARRHPQAVRQVITLGSPIAGSPPLPDTIRVAAIASTDDRIVRAPAAVARDPHAENLTVRGSHSGLAVNAAVYRRLARLLAAAEEPARDAAPEPEYL